MAQVTLSRIFEASKTLATKAGAELEDFINYSAQLAEVVLRNLRNGLTYTDNFDCVVKKISLRHGVATAVDVGKKRPTEARVRFVYDSSYALDKPLQYYFDASGKFTVKATFTPVPTTEIPIDLLILFG